jgi:hypothetical protein
VVTSAIICPQERAFRRRPEESVSISRVIFGSSSTSHNYFSRPLHFAAPLRTCLTALPPLRDQEPIQKSYSSSITDIDSHNDSISSRTGSAHGSHLSRATTGPARTGRALPELRSACGMQDVDAANGPKPPTASTFVVISSVKNGEE